MEISQAEGNFLNLTEAELDQDVYRIMPEKYVIRLFKQKQNVLVQPHKWRDKFENFQLKIGGYLNGDRFSYGFCDDFVGQCWTRNCRSEAMWGIYANDPLKRFVRIRSTPRKLLSALVNAHPKMPHETCFIGKVQYKREAELKAYAQSGGQLDANTKKFAPSLLLKRYAFKHECEIRLLYFGEKEDYDSNGLYRYSVDPHTMITQIMGDPNRDRRSWNCDKAQIRKETGFVGEIKRSKIYDPPDWSPPNYSS